MPLIERVLKESSPTTHSVTKTPTRFYVTPKHQLPGDRVIPVEEIPAAQLADLRARYPSEYAAEAKPAAAKAPAKKAAKKGKGK